MFKKEFKTLDGHCQSMEIRLGRLEDLINAQAAAVEEQYKSVRLQLEAMAKLWEEIAKDRLSPPTDKKAKEMTPEEEEEQKRNERLGRDIQTMLGYDPYAFCKKKGDK